MIGALVNRILAKWPVVKLTRIACWFVLVSLFFFVLSIFVPQPLVIIFGASIAQVIGIVGVFLYFLAIIGDLRAIRRRLERAPVSEKGPIPKA